MTTSNNDSQIRFSLLDLDLPPIPPLPERHESLVSELLAGIAGATTIVVLDQLATVRARPGSAYRSLCQSDRDLVDAADRDRRVALRPAPVQMPLIEETATVIAIPADQTLAEGSTPTVARMAAEHAIPALATIATDAARIAAIPTRGGNPNRARSQSPEQIALATRAARAQGSRLAGYNGRIVDPGQGLGTIVAAGWAEQEYDAVSDRMRQRLIRWSTVTAALAAHGFSPDVLGDPVTRTAHLGQASKILNHSGYIARNVSKSRTSPVWRVGRVDTRANVEILGPVECEITLQTDGTLKLSNPEHGPSLQMAREYAERVNQTMIESADLWARIETALRATFGARKTDLGLYVSPFHAGRALDLVVALRPVAGRKIYAWSHTDRESVAEALCDSFARDLGNLESEITDKSEIKKLAGASLIERIERLKCECTGLASVLGAEAVEGYRARLQRCDDLVVAELDATSQRYAMMELDADDSDE